MKLQPIKALAATFLVTGMTAMASPNSNSPKAGLAVANFTIASTTRTFVKTTDDWKDGDALFFRCNLWR